MWRKIYLILPAAQWFKCQSKAFCIHLPYIHIGYFKVIFYTEDAYRSICSIGLYLMVTGDWFVDTVEKAEAIRSKFGDATVIDMESAAIAQACYKHGKGFASIRMVSDTPLAGNNREQYDNFWAEAPKWLAESVKMIINKM